MPPFSLTQLLPDLQPIDIVHVGASRVENHAEAYEPLVNLGLARVIGFEPNLEELAKLSATAGPRRAFLPYVIGDGGPGILHKTNTPWMTSLLEPNLEFMKQFQHLAEISQVVEIFNVTTKRLDDLAEVPNVDFLKLDVQGAELSVMKGAERLLRSCLLIQTEVEFLPLYKDQPLFGDIDAYLRDRGFLLHTFCDVGGRCFKPLIIQNDSRAAINQVLWADAVYVTDFQALESLSTEQLQKLAVLSHDIYGSSDLCLVILIELDRRAGGKHELEGRYLEMLPTDSA